MKYVLGGLTSFAAVLLVVALVRASVLSQDAAPPAANKTEQPKVDEHAGHNAAEKTPEKAPEKSPEKAPVKVVAVDLGNEADPVSGAKLDDKKTVIEHKGWKIGFADEASSKKFLKNATRYSAKLSLEIGADGKWTKVDASKYEKATAETCPIMGGDIDPEGDVFILHRGFKFYFCCWSGCADEFLEDPAKHYAHYGLVEKDGKLVRK
ncbi:MAG: hypothetical protein IT462_00595 [Planctomycetes bacterium]|nr:hypothetical protein [Planctomycetota bacterium]